MSATQQTILLVEDNEFVRQYATYQLSLLGYNVISATDGFSALDILRARADIDLLFTDMIMPGGLNGRELATEARSIHPELKVLYTSGYGSDPFTRDSDPGAQSQRLNKPYTRQELSLSIRRTLDN